MIAYKGFRPGMICIGYQFQMGLNVTEKANCRQNGFHCAEDPLDCVVLGALKGLDLRDDVPEGLYSDMTMEA